MEDDQVRRRRQLNVCYVLCICVSSQYCRSLSVISDLPITTIVLGFKGGGLCDGGCQNYDDVLMFDSQTFEWKKIGKMLTARIYHGASLVNMDDVIDYCI